MKTITSTLLATLALVFCDVFGAYGDIRMKNTFEIKSWDESPYLEFDSGAKYSRAKLQKEYLGVLSGEGQLEYLMAYNRSGNAFFTGIEHFDGMLNNKRGTFSIAHKGSFLGGAASSTFEIVQGSQTGDFSGLIGEGSFESGHSMLIDFDFSYSFLD